MDKPLDLKTINEALLSLKNLPNKDLKVADIKRANGKTQEDFNNEQERLNKNTEREIENLKSNNDNQQQSLSSLRESVSNINKELDNLKSSVNNGKDNLYAAIIDKKVTPKSKDFVDLAEGIKDIKLGQGNAQASEVLSGRTFTNDTGIMQTGTMPNMGTREIEPKTYTQELGKGYYDNVKVKDVSVDYAINNLFTSDENKKEIINQMTIPKTLEILKNIYDTDISKKEEVQKQLRKNFSCGKAELKTDDYIITKEDIDNGIYKNTEGNRSDLERYRITTTPFDYQNAINYTITGTVKTELNTVLEFELYDTCILNENISSMISNVNNCIYKKLKENPHDWSKIEVKSSLNEEKNKIVFTIYKEDTHHTNFGRIEECSIKFKIIGF